MLVQTYDLVSSFVPSGQIPPIATIALLWVSVLVCDTQPDEQSLYFLAQTITYHADAASLFIVSNGFTMTAQSCQRTQHTPSPSAHRKTILISLPSLWVGRLRFILLHAFHGFDARGRRSRLLWISRSVVMMLFLYLPSSWFLHLCSACPPLLLLPHSHLPSSLSLSRSICQSSGMDVWEFCVA